MRILFECTILEKLNHAAFAAHLSNDLDGPAHRDLVDQLGERGASDVHSLTSPLSDPHALANHDDGPLLNNSEPNKSTPIVTASAGDAS